MRHNKPKAPLFRFGEGCTKDFWLLVSLKDRRLNPIPRIRVSRRQKKRLKAIGWW